MTDYGEQRALDAESDYIEAQELPACLACDRVSEDLSGEDDRFPGLCPACLEDRMAQAAHDDHIEHLIDKARGK